jgi:glycosyltransferase involved in cell wall biosynthesis
MSGAPYTNIAILIPCWQPTSQLTAIVTALQPHGFGTLIIVDDGSAPAHAHFFHELAQVPGVEVLHHASNLGKGRTLKTGFNAILTHHPTIETVITADSDGQHLTSDILALAASAQSRSTARPILGVRRFDAATPLRSRLGNRLTRILFRLASGVRVTDTQTGLRALPRVVLPELLRLPGDRYEYEMNMLAHLCRTGHRPLEIPIATVYLDNNRNSHFDPLRDSMRIYFVLLRFYSSSLIAAFIDFLGFTIAFVLSGNLALSFAIGRLSSLLNFALNRRFVFHSHQRMAPSLALYYALAVGIAITSYILIRTSVTNLHWNVYAAKIAFDVLLSLISFYAQRAYVFPESEPDPTSLPIFSEK